MASKKSREERIRMLVAEILAEEEAEGHADRWENINDIEDQMIRIGDLVARECGIQMLTRHTGHVPEHPPCPDCGHPGQHAGGRARELVTRRGLVPLKEIKYRCPKCRRHFFPSDLLVGTGG